MRTSVAEKVVYRDFGKDSLEKEEVTKRIPISKSKIRPKRLGYVALGALVGSLTVGFVGEAVNPGIHERKLEAIASYLSTSTPAHASTNGLETMLDTIRESGKAHALQYEMNGQTKIIAVQYHQGQWYVNLDGQTDIGYPTNDVAAILRNPSEAVIGPSVVEQEYTSTTYAEIPENFASYARAARVNDGEFYSLAGELQNYDAAQTEINELSKTYPSSRRTRIVQERIDLLARLRDFYRDPAKIRDYRQEARMLAETEEIRNS